MFHTLFLTGNINHIFFFTLYTRGILLRRILFYFEEVQYYHGTDGALLLRISVNHLNRLQYEKKMCFKETEIVALDEEK